MAVSTILNVAISSINPNAQIASRIISRSLWNIPCRMKMKTHIVEGINLSPHAIPYHADITPTTFGPANA